MNGTKLAGLTVALLIVFLGSGCGNILSGLIGTEIEVRSTRQSLREQVLGSYTRIGEEVYFLTGVRAVDPVTGEPEPPPEMTESKRKVLAARRRMEFNRDDITRFKIKGYVGVGNDAKLVFFGPQKSQLREQKAWMFNLVQSVVEEENEDREIVIQRILTTTPELVGETGRRAVEKILADKYRQESDSGVMVQLPDGKWVAKGKEPPVG
ncbi:MAG: DUF1318 domain-containing protein [Planctomycetes bacterium]|nr:DUF1318 domain-containing protein [Planctomycetota bacterium]